MNDRKHPVSSYLHTSEYQYKSKYHPDHTISNNFCIKKVICLLDLFYSSVEVSEHNKNEGKFIPPKAHKPLNGRNRAERGEASARNSRNPEVWGISVWRLLGLQ